MLSPARVWVLSKLCEHSGCWWCCPTVCLSACLLAHLSIWGFCPEPKFDCQTNSETVSHSKALKRNWLFNLCAAGMKNWLGCLLFSAFTYLVPFKNCLALRLSWKSMLCEYHWALINVYLNILIFHTHYVFFYSAKEHYFHFSCTHGQRWGKENIHEWRHANLGIFWPPSHSVTLICVFFTCNFILKAIQSLPPVSSGE